LSRWTVTVTRKVTGADSVIVYLPVQPSVNLATIPPSYPAALGHWLPSHTTPSGKDVSREWKIRRIREDSF